MNPFVVDGIKVNIYGTIENKKTYPETGSFTISFEELLPFNTVDWIENRVVQFIQLLKMEKDFAFNEISFFGKIKIVNNRKTLRRFPGHRWGR